MTTYANINVQQVNLIAEIAMGSALGVAFAVMWEFAIMGELSRIDAFNAKLKQAKKDGLL
jgi:hypothetical protein